jgi:hypothetical protein
MRSAFEMRQGCHRSAAIDRGVLSDEQSRDGKHRGAGEDEKTGSAANRATKALACEMTAHGTALRKCQNCSSV